ncbi:MAG: FG-GAP repeat domain-containing protein, partial [Planctomycetota bacterium]
GDGRADVVVCNSSANTVSVLLAGPGGVLGAPTSYATGTTPVAVRLAHLNADGNLDVVTCDSGGNTVTVLLGAGGGTFGTGVMYLAGSAPADVAIADVNGDGLRDVIVANPVGNQVNVLLGASGGAFGAATSYAVANAPSAVAAADLTGDSRPEIVVVTPGANQVAVLTNSGTGTFGAASTFAAGTSPVALALGDVSGDGKADVIVAGSGGTASLLLGTGAGAFGAPTASTVGAEPVAVTLADLDGDGRLDAVVVNGASQDVSISILVGRGSGTFAPERRYRVGHGAAAVATGDVNGDGHLDIVTADRTDGTVSVLFGTLGKFFTDTVSAFANLYNTAWPGSPYGTPWPGDAFSGGGVGTPGATDALSARLGGVPKNFAGATAVDVIATGLVQAYFDQYTGPEGRPGVSFRGFTEMALIGIWSSAPDSIQPIGSVFEIGASATLTVPIGANVYLFLATNDGQFSDNSGSFSVYFTVR